MSRRPDYYTLNAALRQLRCCGPLPSKPTGPRESALWPRASCCKMAARNKETGAIGCADASCPSGHGAPEVGMALWQHAFSPFLIPRNQGVRCLRGNNGAIIIVEKMLPLTAGKGVVYG